MSDVTLADAKAQLSDLVERATHGEQVRITRRGKPVARIVAIVAKPSAIDIVALRALTGPMPKQAEPARSWLSSIRKDARY